MGACGSTITTTTNTTGATTACRDTSWSTTSSDSTTTTTESSRQRSLRADGGYHYTKCSNTEYTSIRYTTGTAGYAAWRRA